MATTVMFILIGWWWKARFRINKNNQKRKNITFVLLLILHRFLLHFLLWCPNVAVLFDVIWKNYFCCWWCRHRQWAFLLLLKLMFLSWWMWILFLFVGLYAGRLFHVCILSWKYYFYTDDGKMSPDFLYFIFFFWFLINWKKKTRKS